MERQYLIHYNTSNNVVPTAEHMMYGEIAVRYSAGNEAIFIKNTNDEIITLNFNSSVDLFSVVSELPTNDNVSNNKIYLVPSENTGNTNTYIEYINVNGEWEKIGEISVKTDLTEYYTKEEINELFAQTVQNLETLVSDNQTEINSVKEDIETLDITVSTSLTELREELTETINLKADKNEIPSLSGYVTENYVNASLSNYALKSEIPSLEGYLTSIPEEYITEKELNDKGYLTEHQDISNLATKTELNDKADLIHAHDDLYYTESEVDNMLIGKSDVNHIHEQYLTEHQDISGKQDIISDLEDIRSGAILGAKALQAVPAEYVTETELNNKNYATKTDLSTLDSKVISSLNTINSQLSNYALKTELPTDYAKTSDLDNYTTTEYTRSIVTELDNKQNKTITITKKGEDATIVEFVKVLETGPQLDSSKYIIDSDSNSITEESKEIWYLTYENIFTYVTVLKTGTSGPEQWKIYQNETILSFPELGQYKYEGEATKNYYYCTENGKYYKWNINNRILEEITQPSTTVSKTITIQEAIQEIYIKLGLL